MAHECPCGEVVGVEFEGALEICHSFLVLRAERVVVADHAAGFRPVFVNLHRKFKGFLIAKKLYKVASSNLK